MQGIRPVQASGGDVDKDVSGSWNRIVKLFHAQGFRSAGETETHRAQARPRPSWSCIVSRLGHDQDHNPSLAKVEE
ncbi:hypothetical protein GCM10023063_01590 [Arthrobacter methylotrophus]